MEMIISSRLTPAFMVGDATVSLWPTDRTDHYGKPVWGFEFNIPGEGLIEDGGLAGWGDAAEMARSLCSFLASEAERYQHHGLKGPEAPDDGEGDWIFPFAVVEWAYQNSDELSMLGMDPDGEND